MASGKLIKKFVETAKAGRHGDGAGLWLIVSEGGARRWAFRYSFDGKVTEMGLGSFPTVGADDARELAAEARRQVKLGVSPVAARKRAKREAQAVVAARAAIPTFGECADRFIDTRARSWTNKKHRAQVEMTLTKYAAPIRDMPVDEVDTRAVMSVLEPLFKTPTTASRLRNRIEQVINSARSWGYIDLDKPNPARWKNGIDVLFPRRPKGPRKHHAAIDYNKIPALISDLRKKESMANLALEFCILCASRTDEVLGARWAEFDLETKIWTLPAERTKNKSQHRVPLCNRAAQIIERASEWRLNDFVFPGRRKNKPLCNLALDKALKAVSDEGTVHGMRSSFRDYIGNETDHPREVAEAALAHSVGDRAEQAYRRGDALERRRTMMRDWERFCCGEPV